MCLGGKRELNGLGLGGGCGFKRVRANGNGVEGVKDKMSCFEC